MKICAVIVTYNRLTLLQECIVALQHQTYPLDEIIVVNNDSTDGTTEWLQEQSLLTVINQENSGGSGGFYTGTYYAYQKNYDWIWMMDDDVSPTQQCLEYLVKNITNATSGILQPLRMIQDHPVLLESVKLNLANCFKPLHSLVKENDIVNNCKVEAIPFEGPLVHKNVFAKIGFPNKELFIFYDDTDFSYRTILAGFNILLVPSAVLGKKIIQNNDSSLLNWKYKYELRNYAYFNKTYGKNLCVKYFRPFKKALSYFVYCLLHKRNFSLRDGFDIFKYTYNGVVGKLGNI